MKKTFPILFGTAVFISALIAGCDKKDSASGSVTDTNSTQRATSEMKDAAAAAGEKIKATTEKAEEATKEAVKSLADKVHPESTPPVATTPPPEIPPTPTTVAPPAEETKSPAAAQGLIDKAKAYVSEGKYKESLTSLKQLSDYKLTPEQQKTVDSLKASAQKYFSTNTLKSLGGLFQRGNVPAATNP
jgi:outer membrane murein-binding lipoprotein Lpp